MFFSKLIYNIGIKAYYLIALLISPFNKKASLWIRGRKLAIQKIKEESIWFHCASLGEFEQARPLLENLKKNYPSYKIVLTFYSPSGYEIRKNYQYADYVYYLPLDTKSNALNFIKNINPKLVFFVKYEFWYHFINELKEKNIPTYLVSGIFRKEQLFFKKQGVFFKEMLKNFSHLFLQDKNSISLLKNIGITNTSQANDSRFDRVYDIYKDSKSFAEIEQFVNNKPCIILGSSWLEDDKMFAKNIDNLKKYKLIIAPHNINKTRIAEVQKLFSDNVLYSEINKGNSDKKVLIIDNIGMLSSIYKYGTIAYIGGGFGVSIHNILEAAVYSIPVIFGPAHKKMKEAFDLIENGGGFTINNSLELTETIQLFEDNQRLQKVSKIAGDYVLKNTGGTDKVLSFIKSQKILEKIN